ncbi:hypothetical protein EYC84_002081 [Monilinia fructicola]|uniref:Uncharacterized protein n=1 Tax=Monilinia fructicola TaxID=38448 RepID=A0A5M9JU70_MONFR|nr:hypothetical protein EYC84_002081 [Monilinia fructicola]
MDCVFHSFIISISYDSPLYAWLWLWLCLCLGFCLPISLPHIILSSLNSHLSLLISQFIQIHSISFFIIHHLPSFIHESAMLIYFQKP